MRSFSTTCVILLLLSIHGSEAENPRSPSIDCLPDQPGAISSSSPSTICQQRGCVWTEKPDDPRAPKCTFPPDSNMAAGYDVVEEETSNSSSTTVFAARLTRRSTPTLFGEDFQEAEVVVETITENIIRVKISDSRGEAREAVYPEWRENLKNEKEVNGDEEKDAYVDLVKMEMVGNDVAENDDQQEEPVASSSSAESAIEVVVEGNPFGFALVRKSTNRTLLDTRRIPGLTLARQFLQVSARVASRFVYGFGETNHEQLMHRFDYRTWGMFSHDHIPGQDDTNVYGVHPFYLCVEDEAGNSHGVFFLNTHAMHVVLQPDPSNPEGGVITWRAIGGVLEFFLFSGPSPDHVISQYTHLIGRPQFPPYWSLGFQISRWGYANLTAVQDTFDRNLAAGIPQETQVIDIDYMNAKRDFTYDPEAYHNLTDFVHRLHSLDRKLVLILDPAIPSDPSLLLANWSSTSSAPYAPLKRGLDEDVFIIDNQTGLPLEGEVWPGLTYFPDFTKPQTLAWWAEMIEDFYEQGVQFDGLWIDMNEPANFRNGSTSGCANNRYNDPPFNPLNYEGLSALTVCMDADQHEGKHYELHSVYGHTEAIATYKALTTQFPGKRPFILSRSTFAGSGKYTNHWTGDVLSRWSHLRKSVIGMLEFNMFGIPFVGADICGFNGDTDEEMCVRWSQLGAFYPFSRNHNAIDSRIEQDPASWSQQAVGIIRRALEQRYRFLPYLYTLLYRSHVTGGPVVRPIFFDHPYDARARLVDDQFLWGSGLMFAPVVAPGVTNRTVYFPRGVWYDLTHNVTVQTTTAEHGQELLIDMPLETIGIYLQGGQIVPWQLEAMTTQEARQKDVGLIVGLDDEYKASGSLYWDDGESEVREGRHSLFHMEAWNEQNRGGVKITLKKRDYVVNVSLSSITVYGLKATPSTITLDGHPLTTIGGRWTEEGDALVVSSFGAKLDTHHEIVWEFGASTSASTSAGTTTPAAHVTTAAAPGTTGGASTAPPAGTTAAPPAATTSGVTSSVIADNMAKLISSLCLVMLMVRMLRA